MQLSIGAIFWHAVDLIMINQLTVGQLTSFLIYTLYMVGSSSGLMSYYSDTMKSLAASEKIFEILDTPSKIEVEGNET